MSLRSVGKIQHTTTLVVRDPVTRKPLPTIGGGDMTVTLHGPYSPVYKAVLREQQQRRTMEISQSTGANAAQMTPEEIDAYSRELLFRCIESWTVTLEGDEIVPLEQTAVEAVFDEFPWLRDDINIALGNTGNFLARPEPH